jgi:hypothetical protein
MKTTILLLSLFLSLSSFSQIVSTGGSVAGSAVSTAGFLTMKNSTHCPSTGIDVICNLGMTVVTTSPVVSYIVSAALKANMNREELAVLQGDSLLFVAGFGPSDTLIEFVELIQTEAREGEGAQLSVEEIVHAFLDSLKL